MPSFFEIGLGSEGKVKQKWDLIKFESFNIIKLSNNIDEDIWIDLILPLAFDYFTPNDDIVEYLGANFELPKSNKKYHVSYILNTYSYLGQEVNFHDVL